MIQAPGATSYVGCVGDDGMSPVTLPCSMCLPPATGCIWSPYTHLSYDATFAEYGKQLQKCAEADGVNVHYLKTKEYPTGTCAVLVHDKER